MFQESEVVNLLVGFGSVPVIALLARRVSIPREKLLYGGFSFLLVGYVATVLEGVFFPDLLNFIEHYSYAASGLCFLAFALPRTVLSRSGGKNP